MERQSTVHRRTAETDIQVSLDLDGSGAYTVHTGIPFLDHMLSMVARHGFSTWKLPPAAISTSTTTTRSKT